MWITFQLNRCMAFAGIAKAARCPWCSFGRAILAHGDLMSIALRRKPGSVTSQIHMRRSQTRIRIVDGCVRLHVLKRTRLGGRRNKARRCIGLGRRRCCYRSLRPLWRNRRFSQNLRRQERSWRQSFGYRLRSNLLGQFESFHTAVGRSSPRLLTGRRHQVR